MSREGGDVLCRCRGLTRAGVLFAVGAGASSVAEVRAYCETRGHAVPAAPNATHDCCTGVLAQLLRQARPPAAPKENA